MQILVLEEQGRYMVKLSKVEMNGGWYDRFLAEEVVHYPGVAEALAEEFAKNWQDYK